MVRAVSVCSALAVRAMCVLLASLLATASAIGELRFHQIAGADTVPLNGVESGPEDGPVLLLLHGFSQSYLSWLPQLRDPSLTARYRLVAMDLRGHGASGKPWTPEAYAGSTPWADDIHAVVTALKLKQPVLAGWSFGGYVALDYFREYGADAVAGIMLVGSHGGLLPRPGGAGPEPVGDLELLLSEGRQFASVMSANPLPDEIIDHMVSSYIMMPPHVRVAIRGKRLDNQDLLTEGRWDVPLQVILGAADSTVPTQALVEHLSPVHCAETIVYEGVGHSPFAEQTERFNADLARFATRSAGGCGGVTTRTAP